MHSLTGFHLPRIQRRKHESLYLVPRNAWDGPVAFVPGDFLASRFHSLQQILTLISSFLWCSCETDHQGLAESSRGEVHLLIEKQFMVHNKFRSVTAFRVHLTWSITSVFAEVVIISSLVFGSLFRVTTLLHSFVSMKKWVIIVFKFILEISKVWSEFSIFLQVSAPCPMFGLIIWLASQELTQHSWFFAASWRIKLTFEEVQWMLMTRSFIGAVSGALQRDTHAFIPLPSWWRRTWNLPFQKFCV